MNKGKPKTAWDWSVQGKVIGSREKNGGDAEEATTSLAGWQIGRDLPASWFPGASPEEPCQQSAERW